MHINCSALHPSPPPLVLRLPWQPGVAVLMSETPPRTPMQALGQVTCSAAGHQLMPKNKIAAAPTPPTFSPKGESLFELQTKAEVYLVYPFMFLL